MDATSIHRSTSTLNQKVSGKISFNVSGETSVYPTMWIGCLTLLDIFQETRAQSILKENYL